MSEFSILHLRGISMKKPAILRPPVEIFEVLINYFVLGSNRFSKIPTVAAKPIPAREKFPY